MTVTITHAHRDALYDQILDRLSGIGDIWLAASAEDFRTADRLGREYSDELRLVLDDLGWGDGPEVETIELTSEPDLLRRVFARLRDVAAGERAQHQAVRTENFERENRNLLVDEACRLVLTSLDGEQA